MNVVVLRAAEEDLTSIHTYIAHDLANPGAAQNTIQTILRRIAILQNFPASGSDLALVSEKLQGYRSLLAGNYLIIYRFDETEVCVVRILYARIDYTRLF